MGTSTLTLEQQYNLPLVKDVLDENERLRKLAALGTGTKIPDSKIDEITVPYVFENKLLMKEGEFNDVYYPAEEIRDAVTLAAEKGLVYDHLDASDEGCSNWLGHVINPHWDDNGPDGAGMYGDLKIVDKSCAQILASGPKWGISPTIDYQKNEVNGKIIGTELLWKSFSFVLSPAVRDTMLNSLKNEKGELTMPEPKPKETMTYQIQGDKDSKTLSVDKDTLDILTAKDAELAQLRKYREDADKLKRTELAEDLVNNEYLIGRLSAEEIANRKKALNEKSVEILSELSDVVGVHPNLKPFQDYVKTFLSKNADATLSQAAKSWEKTMKKSALQNGGTPPAGDADDDADDDDADDDADDINDANDPANNDANLMQSTLMGRSAASAGRKTATLSADELDKGMVNFMSQFSRRA